MNHIAILCGGDGSRLWPFSRRDCPKQFLDLTGCGDTLLQLTAERASAIAGSGNTLAITTRRYADLAKSQLHGLPEKNLLVEPAMRNTAPAIMWISHRVFQRDPEGIVAVMPSDHMVVRTREFEKVMEEGFRYVESRGGVLIIGTDPVGPSPRHRYLQMGARMEESAGEIYRVATLTGKPDAEMAAVFCESGEFLWNTGIMLFRAKEMIDIIGRQLPELEELAEIYNRDGYSEEMLLRGYAEIPSATIESVIENVSDLYVSRAAIGWSDLGSWNSLYELSPKTATGNVTQNSITYTQDCQGTLLAAQGDKLIVAIGLNDFIVADSGNALLLCPREREEELRPVIKNLKSIYGERFV